MGWDGVLMHVVAAVGYFVVPAYLALAAVSEAEGTQALLRQLLQDCGWDEEDTDSDDGWRPIRPAEQDDGLVKKWRGSQIGQHPDGYMQMQTLRKKRKDDNHTKRRHFVYWAALLCILIVERCLLRSRDAHTHTLYFHVSDVLFSLPALKVLLAGLFLHSRIDMASRALQYLEGVDLGIDLRHADYIFGTHPVVVDIVKAVRKKRMDPQAAVGRVFKSVLADVRQKAAQQQQQGRARTPSPRHGAAPSPPPSPQPCPRQEAAHRAEVAELESTQRSAAAEHARLQRLQQIEIDTLRAEVQRERERCAALQGESQQHQQHARALLLERDAVRQQLQESTLSSAHVSRQREDASTELRVQQCKVAGMRETELELREEVRQLRVLLASHSLKAVRRDRASLAASFADSAFSEAAPESSPPAASRRGTTPHSYRCHSPNHG